VVKVKDDGGQAARGSRIWRRLRVALGAVGPTARAGCWRRVGFGRVGGEKDQDEENAGRDEISEFTRGPRGTLGDASNDDRPGGRERRIPRGNRIIFLKRMIMLTSNNSLHYRSVKL
jgi:hypothetical protein